MIKDKIARDHVRTRANECIKPLFIFHMAFQSQTFNYNNNTDEGEDRWTQFSTGRSYTKYG